MAKLWHVFFRLLCVFGLFGVTMSRSFKIVESRLRYNPKYLANFTIRYPNNTISMDVDIVKTLVAGFNAHVNLEIFVKNAKQYQTLFVYEIDVCRMVKTLTRSVFRKWFQSFMKKGNFQDHCPVPEGHIYLHDWKLDATLVPVFLNPGIYRIVGRGFYGKYKSKNEDFVLECDMDVTIV